MLDFANGGNKPPAVKDAPEDADLRPPTTEQKAYQWPEPFRIRAGERAPTWEDVQEHIRQAKASNEDVDTTLLGKWGLSMIDAKLPLKRPIEPDSLRLVKGSMGRHGVHATKKA